MSETTTIKFEGYSDDTFGAYWKGGDVDHDDCARMTMRVIEVRAGEQRLHVSGIYGQSNVCWHVGIAPGDEDEPLPDWPMRWSAKGYTTVLEIDVPEGFEVALVKPEPE